MKFPNLVEFQKPSLNLFWNDIIYISTVNIVVRKFYECYEGYLYN